MPGVLDRPYHYSLREGTNRRLFNPQSAIRNPQSDASTPTFPLQHNPVFRNNPHVRHNRAPIKGLNRIRRTFPVRDAFPRDWNMLVLISDLHISDGSTGAILDPGAIELLTDRLCDLAYRASWRTDGTYQPIERIDLVLLGDVLDFIHSQRWLAGAARPWNDPTSPLVGDTVALITDDILRRNAETIRRIRTLATEPTISVPQADAAGQPILGADELPV